MSCKSNCYSYADATCGCVSAPAVCYSVPQNKPVAYLMGLKERRLPGDMVCVDTKNGAVTEVYIEKVMYNNPATVVFWSDGTKTVSKCSGGDVYNPEAGLAICIMKKLNGNTATRECLQAWCPHSVIEQKNCTVRTLRDVRKEAKQVKNGNSVTEVTENT